MAISFVCRKCGKRYDAQDCSGNAFCKQCGSFLIKQFKITAEPILPQFTPKHHGTSEIVTQQNKNWSIALQHASENLRKRNGLAKEYVIVSNPEAPEIRGSGVQVDFVFESEYDKALRLKNELTRKHKGKRLEDVFAGKVVSNRQGECYCVVQTHNIPFERASYEKTKRLLISDPKMLPGIGIAREQQLRRQGYHTIDDLKRHPKWRSAAIEFSRLVDAKDVIGLQKHLRHGLPKSHPLMHYLASFCRDEDFIILDIETMGLFGRPIILLGIAEASREKVVTRQFLIRSVSEEACALSEFTSGLKTHSAIISYNGRCFDVPFVLERLSYYGLNCGAALEIPHFDMLHFARRAFRRRFTDCRLETMESYLGIHRKMNIPSALVPEFYDSYQRSGNVGPLVPIVEHNQQDLVTLARLFCNLYQEYD